MMFRILAFWVVLAALFAPVAALACDSDHHPFEPSNADRRHGATVQSGTLVLKPRKGRDAFIAETTPVTATTGRDIDVCVTMTFQHVGPSDNDTGGVAFWSADADNYYYFGMTPKGLGYIEQRINSTTHVLVDFRPVLGANFGQGASNRIEITTIGKNAVIFVNDKEFDRIVGQPPGNIQMMLLAVAGGANPSTMTFNDLDAQSTTVIAMGDYEPSDQAKAGGCDGVAMIDDPFDRWDERWWGKKWPEAAIVSGHLIFAPATGKEFRLWTNTGGGDLDLCSTASVTSDKGQAGLLFWLKGDGDYDALVIDRDGKASVQQSVGGQWTEVLGPVAITNNASGNRLKVSIRGQHAEISVNGTDIGGVAAPQNAGEQVGMLVAMEDGLPVQGSFDDIVVARPPVPTLMAGGGPGIKSDTSFDVHFDNPDDYSFTGGGQAVENGHLAQRPKGEGAVFFHVADAPRNVDMTVKLTFADVATDGYAVGGLFFWRRSPQDYFGLQISSDGWASVVHHSADKDEDVIKDQPLPAIHEGKGVENTLRVVALGDRAALFVNGTRFGDIALEQPTTDTMQLGVYSDSNEAAELWFDDLTGNPPDAAFAFEAARNDHGDPSKDFFDSVDKIFDEMDAKPKADQPPSGAAPAAPATNGPSGATAK